MPIPFPEWIKDNTVQWAIGSVLALVGLGFTIFKRGDPSSTTGEKNSGISNSAGAIQTGDGSSVITNSPGATIINNPAIDSEALARKIAEQLPPFQELKNKEEEIKELQKRVEELEKENNPLGQKALQAMSEGSFDEAWQLLDQATQHEINTSKKKAAQYQIMVGSTAKFINPQKARAAYAKALDYLPDWGTSLEVANFYQFLNDFAKAETLYAQALSLESNTDERATTLNNLALLQAGKNDYAGAEQGYREALGIYRDLAKTNPQTYLPDEAKTLINIGWFYHDAMPDKQKSLENVSEALRIILPLIEKLPYTQRYAASAINLLKKWGIEPDEFIKSLSEP